MNDLESGAAERTPGSASGSPQVLFVQSGPRQRLPIAEQLARAGVPVLHARDVAEGLRLLASTRVVLCVVDLMQDRAALTAVRLILARHPSVAMAAVVDAANPVIAAEAMHAGLTDLLPWPIDEQQLALIVANAHDRRVEDPTLGDVGANDRLFVQSAAMREVTQQVTAAAAGRQHVLIAGEPSTGRTLVARELHRLSGGTPEQFVRLDCGQSPADLERELFGTAAPERRESEPGGERLTRGSAVSRASSGTLYLTSLTEAPARVQARLARLLRDREATLDDRSQVPVELRVIAATEPDPEALVADGRLRSDLAARLSQVRIDMPPLRRRAEDIPLLVVHVVTRTCEETDTPQKHFSRSALALLAALPWHGNGRELVALIEGLVRSVRRRVIQLEDVLEHAALDGFTARIDSGGSLRDAKARFERECITAMLLRHHGRVGEAAKALGIQRTNLYRKVRQLNVPRTLLSPRR
jgi:DNA-binding NtrC family response regulator